MSVPIAGYLYPFSGAGVCVSVTIAAVAKGPATRRLSRQHYKYRQQGSPTTLANNTLHHATVYSTPRHPVTTGREQFSYHYSYLLLPHHVIIIFLSFCIAHLDERFIIREATDRRSYCYLCASLFDGKYLQIMNKVHLTSGNH